MAIGVARIAVRLCAAFAATFMVWTTAPASAEPAQPTDRSLSDTFNEFATALEAEIGVHADRLAAAAAQAAQRAIEDNKFKLDGAESELETHLQAWLSALEEETAKLGILGEETAAQIEALTQSAAESWAELNRSAAEALEWLQHWLDQQTVPEDAIRV